MKVVPAMAVVPSLFGAILIVPPSVAAAVPPPKRPSAPKGGSKLVKQSKQGKAVKGADEPKFTLTILHNNDGESELVGGEDSGGVARFATLVEQEKAAALTGPTGARNRNKRGVILVSAGDNFLAGTAFTASISDGVFYDALALDALGYDAIDLGNHDFDFGPDVLAEFINAFSSPGSPPYLSANLNFSGEPALQALIDSGAIASSTIVKERGELIGIVGATTENLPFISSPRDVVVNDVQPAVQAEVNALEAAGVNIIVLISHLQSIEGDIELASQISGVDVVIAGGGGDLLANPEDPLYPGDTADQVAGTYPLLATDADGKDVPVVTTTGTYRYLGKLVVDFDKDGNVIGFDGGPLRVVSPNIGPDGVEADAALKAAVVDPVAAFEKSIDTNVIATSEVDLDGERSSIRSVETNQGNLIADSQLWAAQSLADEFGVDVPQVALANGGGIRNDEIIPAGDITEKDTFDMLPFGNFVTVVPDVPRAQFKEILENAVSRIAPSTLSGGSGRFAQIAGMNMTFDTAGNPIEFDDDGNVSVAGSRVREVMLDDGTVVVADGTVVSGVAIDVAIIDFLARGGDQYPFQGAAFTPLGISDQAALSSFITEELGGVISTTDYPEGGEGRITS